MNIKIKIVLIGLVISNFFLVWIVVIQRIKVYDGLDRINDLKEKVDSCGDSLFVFTTDYYSIFYR